MHKEIRTSGYLEENHIKNVISDGLKEADYLSKDIVVIIPDLTRSAPVSTIFKTISDNLDSKVNSLDFIIALGTHPPLNDKEINKLVGMSKTRINDRYNSVNIYNHDWKNNLKKIGILDKETVYKLSEGYLNKSIIININERLLNADEIIIAGPVFPHEMVGFSGGSKYLFPGVCGPEIINDFHWISAMISNIKIIGNKLTPPRKIIDKATNFIKKPITSISLVMDGKDPVGIFMGNLRESWSSAVDLSSKINIVYKEKKYKKVIAVMPKLYNELWTAGKGMYKLEPIVEDGGELIIYGPHINHISKTHGKYIEKIGYHINEYMFKNYEKYQDIPDLVKSHCAHVKGIGKYENNKEDPRIEVKLATGISKELCDKINLGFEDYNSINLKELRNREKEGIIVVDNAGEKLYKIVE